MSEAHQVPPEAEEVPADSTRPGPDPSVSGLPSCSHPPLEGTGLVCTECEVPAPAVPSYLAMFEEYLAGQSWIGPPETPLVFHLKRLCAQLDRDPLAPAAVSSAYLQAFSRLDRRRPGAPQGDGLVPPGAQPSIFDEMD